MFSITPATKGSPLRTTVYKIDGKGKRPNFLHVPEQTVRYSAKPELLHQYVFQCADSYPITLNNNKGQEMVTLFGQQRTEKQNSAAKHADKRVFLSKPVKE